jgi:hypothetical protein
MRYFSNPVVCETMCVTSGGGDDYLPSVYLPRRARSPRLTWKKEEFSEVRCSKRPIICGGKYSTTAWRRRFGFATRRLGTFRCTNVYQGVATRNGATTREISHPRTGPKPNFALRGFSKVATANHTRVNPQEGL